MIKNVGMIDRIARVVLAIVLLWIGLSAGGAWMWILVALAIVFAATAATSYCPIEQAIGMNTLDNKINFAKKG
jgi:hypothetical protein